MKSDLFCLFLIVHLAHITTVTAAQVQPPSTVTWNFQLHELSPNEVVLSIEANISPGWHIYSQHIKLGGPLPTHFKFEKQNALVLLGDMNEEGDAVRYYDKIYDMEIAWFANKVTFTQRFMISQPMALIKGTVEYMACNDHLCIPEVKEFSIARNRTSKK